jgi:hypothetical protein
MGKGDRRSSSKQRAPAAAPGAGGARSRAASRSTRADASQAPPARRGRSASRAASASRARSPSHGGDPAAAAEAPAPAAGVASGTQAALATSTAASPAADPAPVRGRKEKKKKRPKKTKKAEELPPTVEESPAKKARKAPTGTAPGVVVASPVPDPLAAVLAAQPPAAQVPPFSISSGDASPSASDSADSVRGAEPPRVHGCPLFFSCRACFLRPLPRGRVRASEARLPPLVFASAAVSAPLLRPCPRLWPVCPLLFRRPCPPTLSRPCPRR